MNVNTKHQMSVKLETGAMGNVECTTFYVRTTNYDHQKFEKREKSRRLVRKTKTRKVVQNMPNIAQTQKLELTAPKNNGHLLHKIGN